MNMTIWRVWKHNRFAGYVVETNESSALKSAVDRFGDGVRVERTVI
jgi:hypothetical protein